LTGRFSFNLPALGGPAIRRQRFPTQKGSRNVKKFIVMLMVGAFLFASAVATIGCGDSSSSAVKKDDKTPEKK